MTVQSLHHDGLQLTFADAGPSDAPALVLLHALGTDHTIWDGVCNRLPGGLRLIRPDMRGHGGSDIGHPPYAMGKLVGDVEALMDDLGVTNAVVVGLSIGGVIAQGLAVKRLDLVRALVLSNTAARIGTAETWAERMETVKIGGIAAIKTGTLARWFSPRSTAADAQSRASDLLDAARPDGWIGCAAALAGTDMITPTSGLRLPALGIAGSEDGSTPPDMLRETMGLIPGSRFELIQGAGHLSCLDSPDAYAAIMAEFLSSVGHV